MEKKSKKLADKQELYDEEEEAGRKVEKKRVKYRAQNRVDL